MRCHFCSLLKELQISVSKTKCLNVRPITSYENLSDAFTTTSLEILGMAHLTDDSKKEKKNTHNTVMKNQGKEKINLTHPYLVHL